MLLAAKLSFEAVFGCDDDGNVQFYVEADAEAWHCDEWNSGYRHFADCADFSADRRPLLALIKAGGGLWMGKASEWVAEDASFNGYLAFTVDAARLLIARAEQGDELVPPGDTDLAALVRC